MNMKLLGAAVAAALLGISTASFGQAGGSAGGSGGSSASGQDTPREAAAAKSGPGSNSGNASGAVTSGSTDSATGNATTGASTTADCSTLTGAAKRRCERDHSSSSGSSSVPVTKVPAQSGPGTNDRTEPRGKPGVGTSSAGSN